NGGEPSSERLPGFRECAAEVGIRFHMDFLPGEQGAKFKVNLYDHGCGTAVADFDGDGYDDIYFVNQLGKNALYHNNRDGTFTDVTEQAGVGRGDRVRVGADVWAYEHDAPAPLFPASAPRRTPLLPHTANGPFPDVLGSPGGRPRRP